MGGSIYWGDRGPFLLILVAVGRTKPPGDQLEELTKLVRAQVHGGDVVLGLDPHWVVILALTDARGVQAIVKKRLRKYLEERTDVLGLQGAAASLPFSSAIYPADGTDVHGLFAKATAMCKAEGATRQVSGG